MLKRLSIIVSVLAISAPALAQDSGQFQKSENAGCEVWNANPQPGEKIYWSGKCMGGKAVGRGIAGFSYVKDGKSVVSLDELVLDKGKPVGYSRHHPADDDSSQVLYREGKVAAISELDRGDYLDQVDEMETEVKFANFRDGLIRGVNQDELTFLVEHTGMTVTDKGKGTTNPVVFFTDKNGHEYAALGRACNSRKVCVGLQLTGDFTREQPLSFSEVNAENLRYVAVSAMRYDTDPKSYAVSNYVILDGGVTPRNIEMNFATFTSIGDKIATALKASQKEKLREVAKP